MPQALVIVESPAKARTISGFLGADYVVESSIGHIRDLPANAADVPAAYKNESWARLGVDVDNDFKPLYVVNADKKRQVSHLKSLLKDVDELLLATDEDREGEAIAWHLLEVLSPRVPVRRMVFHEITSHAIQAAIENPRDLDRRLVDAQEARRILDRLYGYEVSPVLWKKVATGLSAGRVQSVATRIVVERERERIRFRSADYWDLEGTFEKPGATASFGATLVALDGARIATGRDFDEVGTAGGEIVVLDEAGATTLASELADASFSVRTVDTKPYRRRPAPPFMTSTLQQEAGRKLRLSSAQTMRAAQSLYERGYITYMRTDSTTLSETALAAARADIVERFGRDYLPDAPRVYAHKVKNAQEAHEAIRPANDRWKDPAQVRDELGGVEARVYELVWQRTIASQMTDATGETVSVRLGATTTSGRDAEFATSGTVITHAGFRRVYVEGQDEPSGDDEERRLPPLAVGDALRALELVPQGHETQPPARFTEASLVKRLEELGVGRPSTYASIISTIQDRGYVWRRGSALVPSFTAFAVVTLLEQHFPALVDYAFTARMEDDLDAIASGEREPVPWLTNFYFGNGEPGLRVMVSERLGDIDARAVNSLPIGTDPDGVEIVARVGRYGPYLQRGDDTAGIPDDVAPDELTVERSVELLSAPRGDRVLGDDPETGLPVLARSGRFGPYVQLGEIEEGSKEKPRTASLFQTMDPESVTIDEALRLLSLPRVVGADPADGEEITVQNGRYGPYVKKGKETRSLDTEEELFTVTLEDCLRKLAEPKRRRGQTSTAPLRELGDDPNSGKPVVVREGRFGPYVTDGETNASLRKGDAVETVTVERAAELLQDRRDRGPAKKKRPSKKKAPAKKKTVAKKKAAAKKAPAKKVAAKKTAMPDDAD
jgi:DNA topoisomerase-1